MINLIFASGNEHKRREFAELLPSDKFSLKEAPHKISILEDGETFFENAQKKAEAYFATFHHATLSDDSGLVVESLPNELNVQTARFGGLTINDRQRAEKLLEKMAGKKNRNAYFVCVLCVYFGQNEFFFFEGRMSGKISCEYLGNSGFGYDPVFIPLKHEGDHTLAEIPKWKQLNSHRASACKDAVNFFEHYKDRT